MTGSLADHEENAQKLLRERVGLLGCEGSAGVFGDERLKLSDFALAQERSGARDHVSIVTRSPACWYGVGRPSALGIGVDKQAGFPENAGGRCLNLWEGTMAARKKQKSAKPSSKNPAKSTASPTRNGKVRRYSDAEQQKILGTAKREGLTGDQVAKKFGISTVTYYLWRKKAGPSTRGRRGRPASPSRLLDSGELSGQLREAVRARVREMLPEIIEQEIGASLGGRTSRGRRP